MQAGARDRMTCISFVGGKNAGPQQGKHIMARMHGSRQGGYLADSLQCLVIYICTALEAETCQMLQLNQLPQAFAGHLQTYHS